MRKYIADTPAQITIDAYIAPTYLHYALDVLNAKRYCYEETLVNYDRLLPPQALHQWT